MKNKEILEGIIAKSLNYTATETALSREDEEWLIKQAKTLQKIANRWIEIETNGTKEEAGDFYTFVQDTLSNEQFE